MCLFEIGEPAFYLWQNQNTVVIGRHQNAWKECRVRLLEEEGGLLVRRSTGGGAVFHDVGNLNFSFIMPREQYDVHRQLNVVREACRSFGIETEFTGRNDLVISATGAKFSGNAFKFSDTTVLHHGTIMIDVDKEKLGRYLVPSKEKLRAKNIESVRSRVENLKSHAPDLSIDAMRGALIAAFEGEYDVCKRETVSDLDAARLQALTEQFASWDFRMGASMSFDSTLSHRFDWGELTLELSFKNGRVVSAAVWSDAMDEALIDKVAPALNGVRYDRRAIADALRPLGAEMAEAADYFESESEI